MKGTSQKPGLEKGETSKGKTFGGGRATKEKGKLI